MQQWLGLQTCIKIYIYILRYPEIYASCQDKVTKTIYTSYTPETTKSTKYMKQ